MGSFKVMLGFLVFMGLVAVAVGAIGFGLAVVPGPVAGIIAGVGLFLFIIGGIGMIFSSLYLRARGNLAYLKTGSGGARVIKDGGAIIIGFLHEIIPVSLETMKIVVQRKAKESLITNDKLRAEVTAEFYIRVKADDEGIKMAARTLGDKISAKASGKVMKEIEGRGLLEAQQAAVHELEAEKLIDALRTVAAKKTLHELNVDRAEFKKAVMETVREGLAENGLELEDCTISALDQAPKEFMDPENSFDAIGLQNLARTIAEASVQENKFKREAELAIKRQDVETQKAVLTQDQDLAFTTADQQREIQAYKAEQMRVARVAQLESEEAVERRDIEKAKAVQLTEVGKQQNLETAEVEKNKAIEAAQVAKAQTIETAEIEKMKQVEVAQQDKAITVAKKQAELAAAEEARQLAEAKAEEARQKVETVKVKETAERLKQKAIVDKQAEIEKTRQEEQMMADVAAYAVEREARARKEAAEADYLAKTRAAEAARIEKEMEAAGVRAKEMVPVEVAERQVQVDTNRVENVLKPELEAKARHETVSVELTLGQARIQAQQEIGIAFANSLGAMFQGANMTLFGDPSTLAQMTEKFQKGMGLASMIDGFTQAAHDPIRQALKVLTPLARKAGLDLSALEAQVEGKGKEESPGEEEVKPKKK
ncbi:MAG: hypothetical protein AB1896_13195 [Thermodesulfobacteriota bacterium]